MAANWVLPVRAVTMLFAIIELGLTSYVVSKFFSGDSPSQVNFLLFCSIWSILVLIFLIMAPRMAYRGHGDAPWAHKLVYLAVGVVTALFWFAGFIALAVLVGGPVNCGGDSFCGAIEASIAFGAFLWVLFTAAAILDGLHVYQTRGTANTKPPPQTNVYEPQIQYT